jgi:acetoacetyl-CoA synthetase
MTTPIWVPSPQQLHASQLAQFARWAGARHDRNFTDYQSLWSWSVDNSEQFWTDIVDYFAVRFHTPAEGVLAEARMPGARWFPRATLNYTEQVLRHSRGAGPAIIGIGEDQPVVELAWPELRRQIATFARTLRRAGVTPGDRVVAYAPNIPETVVAFLAAASIGATWASCGQEYPAEAALGRLSQLEPVVLIAADGYRHGGRVYDRTTDVATVRAGLPSLRLVVGVSRLGVGVPDSEPWEAATAGEHSLSIEAVPFEHPLWVLFSSGTSGTPKGIVHGHGGILLEHLNNHALHLDMGPEDTFFWFTSPSWTMWNMQVSGLLLGATILCHDGSPTHPATDQLWRVVAEHQVTIFGTSPAYLRACQTADAHPAHDHDLSALRVLGSTGAVLPAAAYRWIHQHVSAHAMIASTTGGTDVCSAFAGAAATVAVWPGEISVRTLGVALAAFDEQHRPVTGQLGELVITAPTPSMPLYFWNDPDGARLRSAYFDDIPGVWRHGDWITVTDRGSVIVHGRSDATLNRNGIRMGSAEIYHALESIPEIVDCLVVGVEQPDGGYWMPLFLQLKAGAQLDVELTARIRGAIRDRASPRHIPDEIRVAPGIPHTRTGKRLEVPVKRMLQGARVDVIDPGAVAEPELLDWYATQVPR